MNAGRNRPKNRHSGLWVGLAVCRMLNAVWAGEKWMKIRQRRHLALPLID